jgi:hypothetical protein
MLYYLSPKCGSSSVGRASAFQAECREFESRLPLLKNSCGGYEQALVAQWIEQRSSKPSVAGSTPARRVFQHGERSQVVKTPDCGSGIRGFDSRRSPLFKSLSLTGEAFCYFK